MIVKRKQAQRKDGGQMKRFLSIILAAIMVFSMSMTSFAAELVSVNDGSDPNIPTSVPVAQFSGHGSRVIQGTDLPAGFAFKITSTHNGKSNFQTKAYFADGKIDYLCNEIGQYAGTLLFGDGKTTGFSGYQIEVKADGDWTLTISTVTNTSGPTMQGHGDKISGLLTVPKNSVVTATHDGKSNFQVRANYLDGKKDYLINEIGAYNGQVMLQGKSKSQMYIEVEADGNWTITIGEPADPCVIPDIN